jgi:hypothetical protein
MVDINIHRFRYRPFLNTSDMPLKKLRFIPVFTLPHLRSESWVNIRINVITAKAMQMKKIGLIPFTLIPPKTVTSNAPSIGANNPSTPILAVSHIAMPVARSLLERELAQITPQACRLGLCPNQKEIMAMIATTHVPAIP